MATADSMNEDHRVKVVAGIITDYWPHRMSQSAAAAIDKFYTGNDHYDYERDDVLWDGSAVLDTDGDVWIVTRDGGMVMRPLDVLSPREPIRSAGIAWLSRNKGPLKVLYRTPEK